MCLRPSKLLLISDLYWFVHPLTFIRILLSLFFSQIFYSFSWNCLAVLASVFSTNVVKAVNFHVMFSYFTRVKNWISTNLKNWKIDFCPSFTSPFTLLFTYIIIYIAFYSKAWFLSINYIIIYINIYLHHYLHCILLQKLSFKLTWFFTLISYCNSGCLFTSIFTSKFTYNPKIINRKKRVIVKFIMKTIISEKFY